MSQVRPFASLSPTLLARKGTARPAMRPQGFPQFSPPIEDLGWNDMGQVDARPSPVQQQRAAIALSFAAVEEARADAAPAAAQKKTAFTLRLDAERHLKLRLACAVTGRSAQQLLTEALDELLRQKPEIEALAGRVNSTKPK
ncbi:MAG TPA: hypothetical protein VNT25_03635 [Allosphingosinicella sp.]|nr:hypothetical protein [Allosphingosinicella sp.]